jgi:hypothetical protein
MNGKETGWGGKRRRRRRGRRRRWLAGMGESGKEDGIKGLWTEHLWCPAPPWEWATHQLLWK